MKTLYSIRDKRVNELVGNQMYIAFCFRHDAQAVRYFADAVLDKSSILNKHPDDYELVKLATIDEEGNITDANVIPLITGTALLASQPDNQGDNGN